MSTLKLNIYDPKNKNEIVKTYTAESYELMLGTVEDIMEVIDIDKASNNIEIAKMIVKCYKQLRPFLKDIFTGLTDDELKCVKVKELVPLFKDIVQTIIEDISLAKSGN